MSVSNALVQGYLNCIEIPKRNKESWQRFKGTTTEAKISKALRKIANNERISQSIFVWPENSVLHGFFYVLCEVDL